MVITIRLRDRGNPDSLNARVLWSGALKAQWIAIVAHSISLACALSSPRSSTPPWCIYLYCCRPKYVFLSVLFSFTFTSSGCREHVYTTYRENGFRRNFTFHIRVYLGHPIRIKVTLLFFRLCTRIRTTSERIRR